MAIHLLAVEKHEHCYLTKTPNFFKPLLAPLPPPSPFSATSVTEVQSITDYILGRERCGVSRPALSCILMGSHGLDLLGSLMNLDIVISFEPPRPLDGLVLVFLSGSYRSFFGFGMSDRLYQ